jgi:hypothetical protein
MSRADILRNDASGRIWYHLMNFCKLLPASVALGLVAYMLLTLWKIWFLRPKTENPPLDSPDKQNLAPGRSFNS